MSWQTVVPVRSRFERSSPKPFVRVNTEKGASSIYINKSALNLLPVDLQKISFQVNTETGAVRFTGTDGQHKIGRTKAGTAVVSGGRIFSDLGFAHGTKFAVTPDGEGNFDLTPETGSAK